MNIEQAIEILLDKYGKADEEQEQAIATAIKALEKQIPKKPSDIASYYYTREKNGTCSICGGHVQGREKFCPNCGQKIDWEGIE